MGRPQGAIVHREPRVDDVPSARQRAQHGLGLCGVLWFAQHGSVDVDDRIGREHDSGFARPPLRNALRLEQREPKRVHTRQFALDRCFVDIGGTDCVGDHAGLGEHRKGSGSRGAWPLACGDVPRARDVRLLRDDAPLLA